MSIFESDKISYTVVAAAKKKELDMSGFELGVYTGPIGLYDPGSDVVIFNGLLAGGDRRLEVFKGSPDLKVVGIRYSPGRLCISLPSEADSLTLHYTLSATARLRFEAYNTPGVIHRDSDPPSSSARVWTYRGDKNGLKTRSIVIICPFNGVETFQLEKFMWT